MLREVAISDADVRLEKKQVSLIIETAETVRDNALNLARKKMLPREQDFGLASLLERREFVDYFKHALAIEIAQVIAFNDQRVQAVFLFEESTNPDAETEDYLSSIDFTIHLLAFVTAGSAAFESYVASLDRALTEVLNELPSNDLFRRSSFLTVLPVTEKDVAQSRGYATLLSSIYSRPLKIWERK